MTTLASNPQLEGSPLAGAPRVQARVWGMTAPDLHDRYWASKRVQVVRLGAGAIAPKGPAMYLLIEQDDLVLFELTPLIKLFNRLNLRALRIRIRDDHDRPYAEEVLADADDRFLAIRRIYRARARSTARGWLTAEKSLAKAWADARSLPEARAHIKESLGRRRVVSSPCKGRVFDAATQSQECLNALMKRWKEPATLIDDIYEVQPGVWLHESDQLPDNIRFAAPVWVGAGSGLEQGDVVVGPIAIADAPGVHPPVGAVEWENLSIPAYRLLPSMPLRRGGRIVKRVFDVAFSLAVLIGTAPLYPLIILAIWIEDGWPPFFAHTRQTIHGRSFPCYKFRTMCRNAEQIKARLVAANVCDGPQFYIADDPRLLKVGKLLRKFQLDELPQFWNVLVGHMSIVGPRPSPDKENQFCPAWREARLSVRPGITGLWQVRRTREPQTDFQEWIRYDLEYVQHASMRLDIWIIMLTVRKVIGM